MARGARLCLRRHPPALKYPLSPLLGRRDWAGRCSHTRVVHRPAEYKYRSHSLFAQLRGRADSDSFHNSPTHHELPPTRHSFWPSPCPRGRQAEAGSDGIDMVLTGLSSQVRPGWRGGEGEKGTESRALLRRGSKGQGGHAMERGRGSKQGAKTEMTVCEDASLRLCP